MDLEQLKAEVAKVTGERDVATKQVADLEARVKELEPLAEVGKTLLVDLKAEIVRVATIIGEQKSAQYLVESIDDVAKLKEIRGEYEKKWDAKRPPTGKAEQAAGDDDETTPAAPGADRAYRVF